MKGMFSNTVITMLLIFSFSLNGQELPNCFFEDFEPRVTTIPPYIEIEQPSAEATVIITINAIDTVAQVSKYIYGTNANIYSGSYNREAKLVEYIKLLSPQRV